MPLSTAQKASVAQFLSFTQADRKQAERTLKANGWDEHKSINAYFRDNPSKTNTAPSALSKMFDKYRDDPTNSPDTISISGTMKYFNDLSLSLDSIAVLVVSDVLQSPTMGELTRTGFTSGWSAYGANSLTTQRTTIKDLVSILSRKDSLEQGGLFRRVYKHTHKIALPAGQRAVPLEMAVEYWKLLFSSAGYEWSSGDGTPWLDMWTEYLTAHWKKAVNKDLWDQTLLFAFKTTEDPSLGWWSEESAWPGVVDDFVGWVGQKRKNGDAMDVS